MIVLEKDETGWWGGHLEGNERTGWFPGSCVRHVDRKEVYSRNRWPAQSYFLEGNSVPVRAQQYGRSPQKALTLNFEAKVSTWF